MQSIVSVYVAGFPDGGTSITKSTWQITEGKITGRNKYTDGYGLVYSNTTLPGMSGGPVIDANGLLVGIHGRAEGKRTSDGTPVPAGLNLGIPLQEILPKLESVGINDINQQRTVPESPKRVVTNSRRSSTTSSPNQTLENSSSEQQNPNIWTEARKEEFTKICTSEVINGTDSSSKKKYEALGTEHTSTAAIMCSPFNCISL